VGGRCGGGVVVGGGGGGGGGWGGGGGGGGGGGSVGDGGGSGGYYMDIMGFRVKWFVNVVEFPHTTYSDVQIHVIRK